MEVFRYDSRDLGAHAYILSEGTHALVIDPSREEAAFAWVRAHADAVDKVLLTHEHCDHCAGAARLRTLYGCPILASEACARSLMDARMNYSHYFEALSAMQTRLEQAEPVKMPDFTLRADETFSGARTLLWRGHTLLLRETPGHSPGSICILADGRYLFSGDTLLTEPTITRFLGGSERAFREDALPWLMGLDPAIQVYPGHLEPFILGDRFKKETEKLRETGEGK